MDSYTEGRWYVITDTKDFGLPTEGNTDYGMLFGIRVSNDYLIQFYIFGLKMYKRGKFNGYWGGWSKIDFTPL